MKNLSLIFLFICTLAPQLHAAPCEDYLAPKFRPILYSLEKNGVTSYLVGVFHQTVDATDLPESIRGAIGLTSVFINEADQTEAFPMDLLFFRDDTKISSLLSTDAMERLHQLFPKLPDHARPVFPYVQYMEGLAKSAIGQGQDKVALMDASLRNYALQEGKQIQFLESQRDIIATYVKSVSPELLEWTLTQLNPSDFANTFKLQRLAFTQGHLEEHAALFYQAHVDTKSLELFKNLIIERNHRWIPKIVDLHAKHSVFLAVGVGHLAGENGLLSLLVGDGFVVRRVIDLN